jgi:hypothetical protein
LVAASGVHAVVVHARADTSIKGRHGGSQQVRIGLSGLSQQFGCDLHALALVLARAVARSPVEVLGLYRKSMYDDACCFDSVVGDGWHHVPWDGK